MMVLVISIGVSASCFLKGPVATLLTFSFFLVGQGGFRTFMEQFVDKEILGGDLLNPLLELSHT